MKPKNQSPSALLSSMASEDLKDIIDKIAEEITDELNAQLSNVAFECFFGGLPMDLFAATEQFDRLTANGWKLDMVAGLYRRKR